MARYTAFQRNVMNLRKILRQREVLFAKSHRGCPVARGCGCGVDRTLDLLHDTEQKLFALEICSYASPVGEGGGYDHYDSSKNEVKPSAKEDKKAREAANG